MTPNDKLLLDHLEHRGPTDWDTAEKLMGKLLSAMRPDLVRYVASFNRLYDVDSFVDEVICTAFFTFRDQYLAKDVRMPFTDQHAERVQDLMKGWLLAMIGKPFAGTRSGMITNAIRKQDAEDTARTSAKFDSALEPDVSDADEYFNIEEARADVASVLRKLPPKKEFVFRIHTGLHDQERLSPDIIVQIARASRMDENSCKYIKYIAKEVLDNGYASLTLNQSTAGKLVNIEARRVRAIVSDVRAALENAQPN